MCDLWASGLAELEASMGWRSGQAYSQDLRERILAAVDAGMSVREAATLFRASISCLYKALIRRRRTGETAARIQHGHVGQKLAAHQEAIRQRVGASNRTALPLSRAKIQLRNDFNGRVLLCSRWQMENVGSQFLSLRQPTM
jgi:transposase